jgi:hypothetical protein
VASLVEEVNVVLAALTRGSCSRHHIHRHSRPSEAQLPAHDLRILGDGIFSPSQQAGYPVHLLCPRFTLTRSLSIEVR